MYSNRGSSGPESCVSLPKGSGTKRRLMNIPNLRFRKIMSTSNIEDTYQLTEAHQLQCRNEELELTVKSLKGMLDTSRQREKALMKSMEDLGGSVMFDLSSDEVHDVPYFDNSTFLENLSNRAAWLTGLLIFQSFSSFILSSNEQLINKHPNIIYFLTMLVGAGASLIIFHPKHIYSKHFSVSYHLFYVFYPGPLFTNHTSK